MTCHAQADSLGKAAPDFSILKETGKQTVVKILDAGRILLDNGQIIRLTGLNIPDEDIDNPGVFAKTARDILADMLIGEKISIYQTRQENWGRVTSAGDALAHIQRNRDSLWVQGTLLSLGLARVDLPQRNPEMAAQMLALEGAARDGKQGLWANYPIILPEETEQHLHSFQIVEGRVRSASLKNNRIYLNFGQDWRTDFTVTIESVDKKNFSLAGYDPLQWQGKTLRVRGWIEHDNGPNLRLRLPESVEVIQSEKINDDTP
jgi:hypothetical protein